MIVVLGARSPDDEGPGAAAGSQAADSLATGLRRLGATVVVGAVDTSAGALAEVLREAETTSGPLEAVVLASVGMAATYRGNLAGLDAAMWQDRVELPLQRTLACFQSAHRVLRIRGGCLVLLVPTLSLVGAAGFVPWTVVAEGQRSLAKSAARVWGQQRITVNCVAVPAVLLGAPLDGEWRSPATSVDPDRPGQPAPALDRSPDLGGDVAAVVTSLVSAGWRGVTGTTIAVDGGVAMTP